MNDQTIDLAAGAIEYSYPRTLTSITDITGDTVDVSLGSYDAPAAWVAPDVRTSGSTVVAGVTTYNVVVQLLIGSTLSPAAGDYWLWTRLHDTPEVLPQRSPGRIRIIA